MAVGRQQVTDLAEELDEDSSWLAAQQQQQQLVAAAAAVDGSSSEGGAETEEAAAAVAAAEAAGWRIPPDGVSSRKWNNALPVMLQVSGNAQHCMVLIQQGQLQRWCACDDNKLLLQLLMLLKVMHYVSLCRCPASVRMGCCEADGWGPAATPNCKMNCKTYQPHLPAAHISKIAAIYQPPYVHQKLA
jgi:hypothetical protein